MDRRVREKNKKENSYKRKTKMDGKEQQVTDERYMRRCIQLARCGEVGAPPNPMVGAVVVWKGSIIGEGYHRRCGGPHAEVHAIGNVADPALLAESTLYVSLEPCAHFGRTPPCADLIVSHRIPRVVVGCQDPFARVNGLGIRKMREAGIRVDVGVLERECLELNERFVTFHRRHRPWVTLKWAQSADGFIARKDGTAVPFSTAFTRMLVHRLRVRYQAVMVGTHTALWDNPRLTAREWAGGNPLRITIDRHAQLPATLHLKDDSAPTLIYGDGDLPALLADLYDRGVQSLLVEGGATLHNAFLASGLWDEARIEYSPLRLGEGIAAARLEGACLLEERTYGRNRVCRYRPI